MGTVATVGRRAEHRVAASGTSFDERGVTSRSERAIMSWNWF
eukprot:COSAG01_NODE_59110_length_302_cov_0.748768_1_plen_41_part_01